MWYVRIARDRDGWRRIRTVPRGRIALRPFNLLKLALTGSAHVALSSPVDMGPEFVSIAWCMWRRKTGQATGPLPGPVGVCTIGRYQIIFRQNQYPFFERNGAKVSTINIRIACRDPGSTRARPNVLLWGARNLLGRHRGFTSINKVPRILRRDA